MNSTTCGESQRCLPAVLQRRPLKLVIANLLARVVPICTTKSEFQLHVRPSNPVELGPVTGW